jgi:hypothetical protein
MQTQGYDDVYDLQLHFIEVYKCKSVDKLCHFIEKNSPPLSMRILAMDALNWVLTKEKKIVSKFCVSCL